MPARWFFVLLGLSLADGGGLTLLPRAPGQGVDKATEAMRHEVDAAKKRQDAMWEKLRALPAPAPENFAVQLFGDVEFVVGEVVGDQDNRGQNAVPKVLFLMTDALFNRGIFGNTRTDEGRREHLELMLAARIDDLNRRHPMTEAVRKTLQLAGQGDIKRFFDRITEVRAQDARPDPFQLELPAYQAVIDRIHELRRMFRDGPFGAGSLFAKAWNKIRSDGVVSRN
jgi:hypothetical protein